MLEELSREAQQHPAFPERLEVGNLTLVMTHAADAAENYRLVDENRAFLSKYLDFTADYTLEKAEANYRLAEERIQNGQMVNYFITHGTEKVGTIGMLFSDDNRAELGYWLIESAQRQGIATRAAEALVEYGFHDGGLSAIELHIKPANESSKRLAARLGAYATGRQEITESGNVFDIWEVLPYDQN